MVLAEMELHRLFLALPLLMQAAAVALITLALQIAVELAARVVAATAAGLAQAPLLLHLERLILAVAAVALKQRVAKTPAQAAPAS